MSTIPLAPQGLRANELHNKAGMVESVDTTGLKPVACKGVQVQVLLPAWG